jgi:hypothetical protein
MHALIILNLSALFCVVQCMPCGRFISFENWLLHHVRVRMESWSCLLPLVCFEQGPLCRPQLVLESNVLR